MIPCIVEAAGPFLKLPLAYFSGFGSLRKIRKQHLSLLPDILVWI